jgi:NAD(P)-dependent dehydrogenase (short-subunit alcohol dehydrogenase family)
MNLSKRYPGKRVIITGAGSGLGRALAIEFAQLQWNVAIADINDARAQETLALIKSFGKNVIAMQCDVRSSESIEKVVQKVKDEWGGLDIMVNNAGVSAGGFMEKISLSDWDWILSINLKGVIHGCRAVIPLFKEQRSGYIVNVASVCGLISFAEMSSYNLTKAATISLSETIKMELSPFGVGVSAVCPAFFKTNLMDQFHTPDERQRKLAQRFFDKSHMSAERVAHHIIKSISRNRFYVIAQIDGKLLWWLKRNTPETYMKVSCFIYRKGYFYKYLGVNPDEL